MVFQSMWFLSVLLKKKLFSHDLIYRQGMSVTCPRICSYEKKLIVEKNKVIRK